MRGHFTEDCCPAWTTAKGKEESRRIFEEFADLHCNGRKRHENGYYGAIVWRPRLFTRIPCPKSHMEMQNMTVKELFAFADQMKEQNVVAKRALQEEERQKALIQRIRFYQHPMALKKEKYNK